MKVYTYTKEQIEAMTAEETENAILEIQKDGGYHSAFFADRLHGTEREEFEANERTLSTLRRHLNFDLNPNYWHSLKNEAERKIANLEAKMADESVSFVPADYPKKKIAELKCNIRNYEAQIAMLTK